MTGNSQDVPSEDTVATGASSGRVDGAHRIALTVVFSILFVITILSVLNAGLDSDEWQHLHVTWSWTKGEIPYRDVFDDHMPLWGVITAPLAAAIGERPSIIILMRLVTLPILFVTLWATWAIGRRMLKPVMSLWAVALLWAVPDFIKYMLQYRPDGLWAMLCTFTVLVCVGGKHDWKRGFVGGFLLGLGATVSIKTPVVLASLVAGACLMPAVVPGILKGRSIRNGAIFAAAFAVGALVPIAVVIWPFMRWGLLGNMYRYVIRHNDIIGNGLAHPGRYVICALVVAAGIVYARVRVRPSVRTPALDRITFIALVAVLLAAAFVSYALVPGQTKLPLYPLAAITFAGVVDLAAKRGMRGFTSARAPGRPMPWLPLAACVLGIALVMARSQPWRDHNAPYRGFLSTILLLTTPADKVMDAKGESIFRDRPYFYALDSGAITRFGNGLLADDIRERCIAARACVATKVRGRFPPRAREFLDTEYVDVGPLCVAGKFLAGEGGVFAFDTVIPARYAVVCEHGAVAGVLDGTDYVGPRVLDSGRHVFTPSSGGGRFAALWARAAEKGLLPFHPAGPAEDK